MKPIDESKLPTLVFGNTHRDENRFLHVVLNYHLGPPDDQLPVEDSGANDFGPRTLAKVKKFQEANKIDIGTKDFKDGIVGPHTWKKLLQKQQVIVSVVATPPPVRPLPPILPALLVPPLTLPVLRPLPLPSSPLIPVPKLKLELGFQLQAGEQGTFPTNDKATAAHTIQIVGILLNKNDKERFHPEGQIGPSISFNRGGGPDSSKTDLAIAAILNLANMPGSGGRFTWSLQAQAALVKSLNNRTPPAGQLAIIAAANLTLIKVGNNDVLQVTTQVGGYLQAEAPTPDNNDRWKFTGGGLAFFGVAGSLALF
jgi:hypothetical protein